jgi:hypothetical protein
MSKTTRRSSGEFVFANTVTFADPSTVVSTTDLTTGDPRITVNSGETSVPGAGAGIEVESGGSVAGSFLYTSSGGNGTWTFTGEGSAEIDFQNASFQNFSITSLNNLSVVNFTSDNVNIGGGEIDGTTIGATTPAVATFTDLTATGNVDLGPTFSGNEFTGNVTGNVHAQDTSVMVNSATKTFTGDLAGAVTGHVTGDVNATNGTIVLQNGTDGTDATFRGNILSSDGNSVVLNVSTATPVFTGNVTGRVSTLDNFTTDDLGEGSANLYFTNQRVEDRLANISVASFSDVDLTGVASNDILQWDGANFVPAQIGYTVTNYEATSFTDTDAIPVAGASLLAGYQTSFSDSITVNTTTKVRIEAHFRFSATCTSGTTEFYVQLKRTTGTAAIISEQKYTVSATDGTQIINSVFDLFEQVNTGTHTYAIEVTTNNNTCTLVRNPAYSGTGTATSFIQLTEILVQNDIITETGTATLSNKTLTSPVLNGTLSGTAFKDEDNMASDSATAVASQQSIKAYVDSQVATANELSELTDVNTTGAINGSVLIYDGSSWIVTNDVETTTEISEDTTPQLGGDLDVQAHSVTSSTGTVEITSNVLISGTKDLTISGNLTVQGETTTIDVTQLEVDDPMVYLNRGVSASATNPNDAGIMVERGTSENNTAWFWDENDDRWKAVLTTSSQNDTDIIETSLTDIEAGTVHATATSAQYADLAELYVTDEEYEPGTVLVFGGTAEVTQSTKAMDHKIAGVVSSDPAYLMNRDQKGKTVAVALRGRVPVNVIGPVKKGDLIVTSDTPGVGQAYAGVTNCVYVIGKSIEDDDTENLVRLITCLV